MIFRLDDAQPLQTEANHDLNGRMHRKAPGAYSQHKKLSSIPLP